MSTSAHTLDTASTTEAATYLGLSPRTLEKWRSTGRGPVYARLGRLIVYRFEDLDNWVMANRVGGESE